MHLHSVKKRWLNKSKQFSPWIWPLLLTRFKETANQSFYIKLFSLWFSLCCWHDLKKLPINHFTLISSRCSYSLCCWHDLKKLPINYFTLISSRCGYSLCCWHDLKNLPINHFTLISSRCGCSLCCWHGVNQPPPTTFLFFHFSFLVKHYSFRLAIINKILFDFVV